MKLRIGDIIAALYHYNQMSLHTAAYENANGPGDQRPTASQIIQDDGLVGKMSDKVVLITGVSSGIGLETARALSLSGCRMILTARDITKASAALGNIWNPERMDLVKLDLESFADVRLAAKLILAKYSRIHVLINNAGIMAIPGLQIAQDGE